MKTKKEFEKLVTESLQSIDSAKYNLENLNEVKHRFVTKYGFNGVFNYARWCEMNFEANLREDYTRKTTFTSDFSIAEWCEANEENAVLDTLKRCLLGWFTDKVYFAELVIALNSKCWEHNARENDGWSAFYADLYYIVKDLYFEWFGDDDEAISYYFDYVD